jgi:lysozyme
MTSDARAALRAQLIRHEGSRAKPYRDTVGTLTIGVGRNLEDVGLFPHEIETLLETDIARTIDGLMAALPWVADLDDVRQRVLVDMAFNLGVAGLLGFRRTLAAVQAGDYEAAARGMLASLWATQVKGRALTLARMMRTGAD